MDDNWTSEMQAQFEHLKEALTDVIKTELRGAEERLAVRLEERLGGQLDKQLTKGFDEKLPPLEQRLAARIDEQLTARLDERLPQLEERLTVRLEERLAVRVDEQLTKRLDERLPQLEERLEQRLSHRFDGRFQLAEDRLSGLFKTAVEDVRGQVKFLGEAFGGTLDAIRHDIANLDRTLHSTLEVHRQVLSEHTRDIESLKRRLPQ